MATKLDILLDHIGFSHRPQQDKLFEALTRADRQGVIVQAGTGTGKSLAVLAAAAQAFERLGEQSLIVTPTRVLMDQYLAKDVPAAREVFGLDIAELRGRSHYDCERSRLRSQILGVEYEGGCWTEDVGCSLGEWQTHGYTCGYQEAKEDAMSAHIVVTNTDFWLINDRLLGPQGRGIFELGGALFVDEAHQLDAKMRDFAARSMSSQRLRRRQFFGEAGETLADWIDSQGKDRLLRESPNFPVQALLAVANATLPDEPGKAARETKSAAMAIVNQMRNPNDSCVLFVDEQKIHMQWTSVASASGEVLSRRPFALVSGTVPNSMPRVLGVPEAHFLDVGHPFDYSKSTLAISNAPGDFKSRGSDNFRERANDVYEAVRSHGGGALILVNSNRDLEFLFDYFEPKFRQLGISSKRQGGDESNEDLAAWFKSGSSNKVLFGMESFRTGFDVPGQALRLVVLWALPYPGLSPVISRISSGDFRRYDDMMRMSAVQGIGRLVRTTEDSGQVLIADSRGARLLDGRDPMTAHLTEFRRVKAGRS